MPENQDILTELCQIEEIISWSESLGDCLCYVFKNFRDPFFAECVRIAVLQVPSTQLSRKHYGMRQVLHFIILKKTGAKSQEAQLIAHPVTVSEELLLKVCLQLCSCC